MFPHAFAIDNQPRRDALVSRREKFLYNKKEPHRDRWRPDITGDKRGELISEESDVMSLR
jgi:hypothetical protein